MRRFHAFVEPDERQALIPFPQENGFFRQQQAVLDAAVEPYIRWEFVVILSCRCSLNLAQSWSPVTF